MAVYCIECGLIIEGAKEGGRGRPKLRHETCAKLVYTFTAFEEALRDKIREGMPAQQAADLRSDLVALTNEVSSLALRGSANPASKLTESSARRCLVDFAAGVSIRALAERESVSESAIRRLVRGESWTSIPRPPGLTKPT